MMWDQRYADRADKFAQTPWWNKEAARVMTALAPLKDGSVVLDIGCNTGRLIEKARRLFPNLEYIGMDVNVHGLWQARERLPGVRLIDDTSVLRPMSVDCIVIMHTLPQMVEVEKDLAWAWVAMKKGATIVVVIHNPYFDMIRRLGNVFTDYVPDHTIRRHLTKKQLVKLMGYSGFECQKIEMQGTGVIPMFRRRIIYFGRKV